jgi:nitroimidazol reductase NimA-like FMN-containing flavoprotein (pyridoxamine 5'-phosphate oxidase superfamily)
MRRKEKEIREVSQIEDILQKGIICRIGLSNNDLPYIVPVNYGYNNHKLYFHSATEGKKLDMIRNNPNICIQVDIETLIEQTGIPCNWSTRYKSVVGFGTASVVSDEDEKANALKLIVKHYKHDFHDSHRFDSTSIENLTVIRVDLDKLSGKRSD